MKFQHLFTKETLELSPGVDDARIAECSVDPFWVSKAELAQTLESIVLPTEVASRELERIGITLEDTEGQ